MTNTTSYCISIYKIIINNKYPDFTSHNLIILSSLPLAINLQLGCHSQQFTSSLWPINNLKQLVLCVQYNLTVLSLEADIKNEPSGLNFKSQIEDELCPK